MMEALTQPLPQMALLGTLLAALAMITAGALRGWSGWLALKHRELELTGRTATAPESAQPPSATQRIEIADLKERIRKLEAIAAGVDL